MMNETLNQYSNITLCQLYEKAYDCQIRVTGAVKEIFQHKKYIIELVIANQVFVRCLKRYSDFEALAEVIQMNFKNVDLNLGEFPSKFQVFNREQTRRKYFQILFNRILEVYCEKITNQTNRRLLSTLYVFLVPQHSMIDKHSNLSLSSLSKEGSNLQKQDSMLVRSPKSGTKHSQMQQKQTKRRKISEQGVSFRNDQDKMRMFFANEFLVRFQDQTEWKERYLKLQNSCLLIYKHKSDNHFKTKIQLYQAQISFLHRDKNVFDHFCEKMQLDNQPTFKENHLIISISHDYDYKKFMIKAKPGESFDMGLVKQLLENASHKIGNNHKIEGVFSPIGKIVIVLHSVSFTNYNGSNSPIVFMHVQASGLCYETKRMTIIDGSPLHIKQAFIFPVSNAFANIKIQIMLSDIDGVLIRDSHQKCVGRYCINFADVIAYPQGNGLQKLVVDAALSGKQKYSPKLELSLINFSNLGSIYADSYANQNDGVILSGFKSASDTDILVITVDRVLRVIGNIALLITAFWRNVYLFKYPPLGYTFFTFLLLLFAFGTASTVFELLLTVILFNMVYHIPACHSFLNRLLQQYVFCYRHASYKQPLCISTNQLKFLKWKGNLVKIQEQFQMGLDGRLSKKAQIKDKKYDYWQFVIDKKTFKIKQQLPSFLQKVFQVKKIIQIVFRMINAVINVVQKIFNLFSWADPRRSLLILCLLLLLSNVANHYLIRAIFIIFSVHRLVRGYRFYQRKHYKNNRKLAIYVIRYIINKSFANLIQNTHKKIETLDQVQITKAFAEILFPIRQEDKLKKLKEEIQYILGVYIDQQELIDRQQKKNAMRLYYLVQIIESCEARLKLQWISGEQGISAPFQELKKMTSQELLMDLWVQSLIFNFILNIPSQLFTTFRPIRKQLTNQKQSVAFKKIIV